MIRLFVCTCLEDSSGNMFHFAYSRLRNANFNVVVAIWHRTKEEFM